MTAAGPSDSVVIDLDAQLLTLNNGCYSGTAGVCVLDHVCQRFTDQKISRRLDAALETTDLYVHAHRERDPGRKRIDSGTQPAASERRGEDPVRQFSELGVGLLGMTQGLAHKLTCVDLVLRQGRERKLEDDNGVHETLLCAVMQIALNPSPAVIAGGDNTSPRSGQSGTALGVGDGRRQQFGERGEPFLRIPRQRLLHLRTGDHHSPETAVDENRRADGRAESRFARGYAEHTRSG